MSIIIERFKKIKSNIDEIRPKKKVKIIAISKTCNMKPIKTLFNFDAINITVGLPFVRISPDHGPNSKMLGQKKSDPTSFFYAMNFAEKIR